MSISPDWPRGISGKRGVVLNDAKIAVTREAQLNFTQILGLKPGQELVDEFPFQQLNGKLTNGREIFPIHRTPDYIDAYKFSKDWKADLLAFQICLAGLNSKGVKQKCLKAGRSRCLSFEKRKRR